MAGPEADAQFQYQKIFQLLFSYRENELCAGRIWKYCFDSLILQVNDSLEKTLMLFEGLGAGGEGDDRG